MLKTFVMAMVPIIELRGAIPYGAGIAGLPIWQATLIAVLGNLLPIPFLVVFTRDIFSWMRKKSDKLNNIVQMMERKADRNKDVVLRNWSMDRSSSGCDDGHAAQESFPCNCPRCSCCRIHSYMGNIRCVYVFIKSLVLLA